MLLTQQDHFYCGLASLQAIFHSITQKRDED